LSRALDALKSADVNLTLVYSRPISGRSWEYSFYVDMEYSCPEAQIDEMLHHLKESTTFLKVVGHYGVAYQDAVLL
jgi:chorismate mutase/prephenate dehydratase